MVFEVIKLQPHEAQTLTSLFSDLQERMLHECQHEESSKHRNNRFGALGTKELDLDILYFDPVAVGRLWSYLPC